MLHSVILPRLKEKEAVHIKLLLGELGINHDFNYFQTDEQIADLFTKALAEPKFIYFRDKVMYRPPEVTVANTDEVQDKEQTMKVLDTISMEEVD